MRTSLTVLTAFTLALLLSAGSASAKNLYIPVAGRTPGANETYWRTDVRIFNPSAVDDIQVSLHFLFEGMDGSNIPGRVVVVPRRQMLVLNDVVKSVFGMESGLGALRLDSDTASSYAFTAESRTYTTSPAGGTYGQFIPALDPDDAVTDSVVLHVSQNGEFRSNAGVMNPWREAVQVTASLVAADGTLMVPEVTLTVPPQTMIEDSLPAMFGLNRQLSDGFIVFRSTKPVFTWASVVDNRSGDAICVIGAEDKAEVVPLP